MANETVASSYTETISAEWINHFIRAVRLPARAGQAVCWTRGSVGSIPVRFPREDTLSVPAGTKTEVSDFSRVELTQSESSITPGIVGFEVQLSDEMLAGFQAHQALARIDGSGASFDPNNVPMSIVVKCLDALMNRVDKDILAASTSSTQQTGAITDALTREKWHAATAVYRALELNGAYGHAFVGSHSAFRELSKDENLSAAQQAGSQDFRGSGPISGYLGKYYGFDMFESGNVADETTGKSNIMTPIGTEASGLTLVLSDPLRHEFDRGVLGQRSASRFHVFRVWYGTGLNTTDALLEVLST